jgi:hypothetical protein
MESQIEPHQSQVVRSNANTGEQIEQGGGNWQSRPVSRAPGVSCSSPSACHQGLPWYFLRFDESVEFLAVLGDDAPLITLPIAINVRLGEDAGTCT